MICDRTQCPQHPVCDMLGADTDASIIALEDHLDIDDDLDIPQDCPIL